MRLRTCNRNLIDEMNSDKNLDIFSRYCYQDLDYIGESL